MLSQDYPKHFLASNHLYTWAWLFKAGLSYPSKLFSLYTLTLAAFKLTHKISRHNGFKQGNQKSWTSKLISFLTSRSVRIVRSCFLEVTTILSLLSLLFSVYQCYQEQDLVA